MNFFGHAVAASWHDREPTFALGAMLPDFAGMCGMRLEAALDGETAAGVDYHHATDRAFHRLEAFSRAVAEIGQRLILRGVPRGPARGVAHVGFELCLDGALLEQTGATRVYQAALAAGTDPLIERALKWSTPDGAHRWRTLCARLSAHGTPIEYRDPTCVADRVERVLSRRRLLALNPGAAIIVVREMPAIAARVTSEAAGIVEELRAQLS